MGSVLITSEEFDLLAETGWHPIETAPQTGKMILCWDYDYGCMIIEWCKISKGWRCSHDSDDHQFFVEPTHWMALPGGPK